jgi:hypothetical protein
LGVSAAGNGLEKSKTQVPTTAPISYIDTYLYLGTGFAPCSLPFTLVLTGIDNLASPRLGTNLDRFASMDTNDDGSISRVELTDLLVAAGETCVHAHAKARARTHTNIQQPHTQQRRINRCACPPPPSHRKNRARIHVSDFFRVMDPQRRGFVSFEVLKQVVRESKACRECKLGVVGRP